MSQALSIKGYSSDLSEAGSKEPVLLIAGWGIPASVFDSLAAQLSATHQVYLLDLPGQGTNADCHLLQQGGLTALVSAIAGQIASPTWIVGWSLGGLVAQALALAHPQCCLGLICIASSPRFIASEDWPGVSSDVFKQFADQLTVSVPATLKRFVLLQSQGGTHSKADNRQLLSLFDSAPEASEPDLLAGLDVLRETDLRADMQDLQVPCTFILCQRDPLVPIALESYLVRDYPRVSVTCLEEAAHTPFLSAGNSLLLKLKEILRTTQ